MQLEGLRTLEDVPHTGCPLRRLDAIEGLMCVSQPVLTRWHTRHENPLPIDAKSPCMCRSVARVLVLTPSLSFGTIQSYLDKYSRLFASYCLWMRL